MRRGMGMVAGWVWRMRGRRFITVVGIGGADMWRRMDMALGSDMWGMGGWMRTILAMAPEMIRATILDTTRGMATMGLTMLGRIRTGPV